MDTNEDPELRRAIALSLQETRRTAMTVLDLDDDEAFQADLQRALAASKVDHDDSTIASRESSTSQLPSGSSSSSSNTFLVERTQLERARIERQKRLRRDVSQGEYPTSSKRQHMSSSSDGITSITSSDRTSSSRNSLSRSGSIPVAEQRFWDGEMRQIANMHANPRKDGKPTFRLTEILGKKADLAFAILSSYSLSMSWTYEFFDPSVPVIMVAQPDDSGNATIKNVFPNWIRTTPFLRNGRGCMHMKFMLLFYKCGRLRVVVSTANLVDFDWRDIENTAWLQDIPLRPTPIARDPGVLDDFPTVFQRVLHSVNVRPALQNLLRTDHPDLPLKSIDDIRTHWDWSKVKVHLVPSIAGKHEGWPEVILVGHTRLMKAIRNMGMHVEKGKGKEAVLECQGSSIGTYSTHWMNEFHWSARGLSAEAWLGESRNRRTKLPWPPIKVIFPSRNTVQQSVLGEPGGGTIFCRRNQWESARFPRELFFDSKSKAGAVLMHSKMIIGTIRDAPSLSFFDKEQASSTDSDTETDDSEDEEVSDQHIGWAYVGSHNFTPSAWGTLSGSAFNPVLNITNYELGIVFPIRDENELESVACWERPPKKYKLGEDRPWMQEESEAFQAE